MVMTEIIERLSRPDIQNIAIICHIRADGDTLGSAYGLKYSLEKNLRKDNVRVLCAEKVKDRLKFICGEDDPSRELEFTPDLFITVDIAEPILMGDNKKYADDNLIDIKIDHHPADNLYGKLNLIDTDASSCGEIVFKICKKLGAVDTRIGEPLYAAICSDTGNFKYRNVTSETHRAAADLMETGIDITDIHDKIYGKKTQKELTALKIAYNDLHYYHGGKVAVITVTNEMKKNNGINDDDLGEISSIPLDIKGVDLGITIKQNDDTPEKYRTSMRSNNNVNASEICGKLGGGGHVRASGAIITADSPEKAEAMIMEAVISVMGDDDE